MRQIILIQPRSGNWDRLGLRPPDSLLAVSVLLVREGYDVKIIDTRIQKNWKPVLMGYLKNNPICVGVTSMTGVQIGYALEISRFVKENSSTPVVWGGVHPSILPEQTLSNKYIDFVVCGEGELTFFELVKAIEKGIPPNKVAGLYYKADGRIKTAGQRALIQNLDDFADIPYHLIDVKKYYGMNLDGKPSFTLITSRGCPFRCAFCYNTVYNRNRWRSMSAARVVEQIKYLVDTYKIKNIYFHDDNFCASIPRVDEITKSIIHEKIDIVWGLLGTRIDSLKRMSDSFLRQLARAGCVNIDVGIESGSERMLKLIKKDIQIKDVIAVNRRLSNHQFLTKYTFVAGFPTETDEEVMQSVRLAIKLARENRRAYTPFYLYTLIPGTELYNLALKMGFKEPNRLEDWSTFTYENVCYRYPWLDNKKIRRLKSIQFVSNFANKNISYKINTKLVKSIFWMYHPVAKFRFEKNFHKFPMEVFAAQLFDKILP